MNTGEKYFFSLVFIFVLFCFVIFFPFIYFLSKTWINRDSMISEVIGTRTGVNDNSRRNRDSLRVTNNCNIRHKECVKRWRWPGQYQSNIKEQKLVTIMERHGRAEIYSMGNKWVWGLHLWLVIGDKRYRAIIMWCLVYNKE